MLESIDNLIYLYDDKAYDLYQIADELYKFSDINYNDFVEYCRAKLIEKYSKLEESQKGDQEVVEYFKSLPHLGYINSDGDFIYPEEAL